MIKLECNKLKDLPFIASRILALNQKKIAFSGELGAGKTTLIKELCFQLGYEGEVTSPTFTLINEYEGRHKIYHIDFYRLRKPEEVYELGYEEIFFSEDYVFIEWPEKIEGLIPDTFLNVRIMVDGEKRIFELGK